MARLRLFASVREAAGTAQAEFPGGTVGEVIDAAIESYGAGFEGLLGTCKVWCNGEPATRDQPVSESDEVAVLPPVSGGSEQSR